MSGNSNVTGNSSAKRSSDMSRSISANRSGGRKTSEGSGDDRAPVNGALSRRRLLGTAGAAGATGLVLGAAGGATGYATTRPDEPTALTAVGSTQVMFHGKHQPGITTPLQARGHLVAFDLAPGAGRRKRPHCCADGRPWPGA